MLSAESPPLLPNALLQSHTVIKSNIIWLTCVIYVAQIVMHSVHVEPALDRKFAHTFRTNGKMESTCLTCFSTVCSCWTVDEILSEEAVHCCKPEPWRVESSLCQKV